MPINYQNWITTYWNFKHADLYLITVSLSSANWECEFSGLIADKAAIGLITIVLDFIDKYVSI